MSVDRSPSWAALRGCPPEQVCRDAEVRVDDAGSFVVPLLEARYRVSASEQVVLGPGPHGEQVLGDEELLLVAYLAKARLTPFSGRWVSPEGLPGGDLFFRGPHAPPVLPLIRRFGADPGAFLDAALALGGSRLSFGDVSAELRALPRIPVALVLWTADEEFPARASMLFASSVAGFLPLDVLLALMGTVVRRLVATAGSPPRRGPAPSA